MSKVGSSEPRHGTRGSKVGSLKSGLPVMEIIIIIIPINNKGAKINQIK